jgi:hypothetical protein
MRKTRSHYLYLVHAESEDLTPPPLSASAPGAGRRTGANLEVGHQETGSDPAPRSGTGSLRGAALQDRTHTAPKSEDQALYPQLSIAGSAGREVVRSMTMPSPANHTI